MPRHRILVHGADNNVSLQSSQLKCHLGKYIERASIKFSLTLLPLSKYKTKDFEFKRFYWNSETIQPGFSMKNSLWKVADSGGGGISLPNK